MTNSTTPLRPLEVKRDVVAQTIRIAWSDGHASEYSNAYLRGWCPCAGCQGHGAETRFIAAGNPAVTQISVVGSYALSIVWGDGHDTGIYPYRRLRALCPCAACGGTTGAASGL